MEDFKAGDILFVKQGHTIWLDTVKSITRAGNIKTEDGSVYYPDGTLRGGSAWHRTTMKKATAEDIERVETLKKKSVLLNKLNDVSFRKLSLPTLEALWSIIEGVDE